MVAINPQQDNVIAQIGTQGESRVFTLEEARDLFPLVHRITHEAAGELKPVQTRLQNMLASDPRLRAVSSEYEAVVKRWVDKMERLGLVVSALWRADFDTGDGYFSWKYPEHRLGYYRTHAEAFDERRPIDEVVSEDMPDWA